MTTLIDAYRDKDSVFHNLDARVKIVSSFFFIFIVVSTGLDEYGKYCLYALFLAAVLALSRLGTGYVIKRSLVIIPFTLLVAISIPFFRGGDIVWAADLGPIHITASREGISILAGVLARSLLSITAMIILSATTPFQLLLEGFESLHVPRIMILTISFMNRYMQVISEEAGNAWTAVKARSFPGGRIWHMKLIGNIVGNLFIRSYERSERIYNAMLARGYSGEIRTVAGRRINGADLLFLAATILSVSAVAII